jgi:hypothetical protein
VPEPARWVGNQRACGSVRASQPVAMQLLPRRQSLTATEVGLRLQAPGLAGEDETEVVRAASRGRLGRMQENRALHRCCRRKRRKRTVAGCRKFASWAKERCHTMKSSPGCARITCFPPQSRESGECLRAKCEIVFAICGAVLIRPARQRFWRWPHGSGANTS